MPAAIDAATRADIAFYAAQGYSQEAIAEETGVSRRTVRKYLDRTREVVEDSADPRATLCAILRDDYDWVQGERAPDGVGTGDLMSL
jgi:transcriptional regulator with XRE-family HTH domain